MSKGVSSDLTGVILAAGFGSRLQGANSDTQLKPLTLVGGEPLLIRAARSLSESGCARVVIVLGHGAVEVERAFREAYRGETEVVFTLNDRFELANGVSVLAARPHLLGGRFILAMADHVVGAEVMRLAGAHAHVIEEGAATLLVDYKLDTVFDMDDATKVLADSDKIAQIGKQIPTYNCVDCGIFVCTTALMDALALVFDARGDTSLSDGVQALASRGRMGVLDIGDGFWQDVDTPEMLAEAERILSARAGRE